MFWDLASQVFKYHMVKGGLISPGVCFEGIWKLLGQIPIEKKKKKNSELANQFIHTHGHI